MLLMKIVSITSAILIKIVEAGWSADKFFTILMI